ncbi:hypothetical protein BBV17_14595 [Cytobacillus oceanisediminis]|uniref:Uncharacterized protein n=1 Tax=Cytobacillus oceanisediminis TaxID=665099 RepID=A0ABX3CVV3_9BACI|nr:hypothetical protein BBV17_14595 [Cytobacillus oceanisediminis]
MDVSVRSHGKFRLKMKISTRKESVSAQKYKKVRAKGKTPRKTNKYPRIKIRLRIQKPEISQQIH